jgi:hypothetical protein
MTFGGHWWKRKDKGVFYVAEHDEHTAIIDVTPRAYFTFYEWPREVTPAITEYKPSDKEIHKAVVTVFDKWSVY